MKTKPHSEREIGLYMADGIEASARECERDGFAEKAARMFAWAKEVREEAERAEDEISAPDQGDLFGEAAA